ncbi:MAG: preprotein translocase subunit SecA [Chlamydiae bacterium]|nr:preprotein translocase subunit SecA [Chlamydiota bacterium]
MASIIKKIFGTAQSRLLRKYGKIVKQINLIDEQYKLLTDQQLRAKTQEFKERIASGESLDQLLPEAYATVKNACRRLCGTEVHVSGYTQKWDMVPYDVQMLGGIAMHYGAISEMQTGEGKTLTASMPLYLNSLTGKPTHLITVNDYLAQRDCDWTGAIFRWLGLSASALTNATPHHLRKQVYSSDIVYGTASEFGFDYLRDNSMAQSMQDQCQRGHYFAIVDEIDSILIDEARTPLIISGPSGNSRQMYDELKEDVSNLVRIQRDLCSKIATDAKKTLDKLQDIYAADSKVKPTKEQDEERLQALKNLWLVSKGMPQTKILKRIKEDPDLRAELEKWETYFYAEPNSDERHKFLSELFIIVDERASEYELTDKGIHSWMKTSEGKTSGNDFLMLDLGYEYALIDTNPDLSEQEKVQEKVKLREEDASRKERSHNLRQMLRAHLLMEKDVDYIIEDDKIVIIDENTGRPQAGRRFSDGLHQAIEAKEGVAIQGETQTYATITLQNYFRLYTKLAGMTGTAMTEANEFKEIYKLEVVAIPTHKTNKRVDYDDEIYMTEREKYNALIRDIEEIHKTGRPILIGTESVDVSEKLSRILRQKKLEHTVLNAKNHEREAEIVAEAGTRGAITVATNMAGRGTDIKLKPDVASLGGLHVIGTTRHQSRRIDRQLRGRCARLGDPGSSKFYVSFEDSLMRLFTSPKVTGFLQRFRPPEGEAISAKILNKSIETAQKRVEQRNYTMRKHTLEYDDVMNKQRAEIYSFRNEVLSTEDSISVAKEILENVCLQMGTKLLLPANLSSGIEKYSDWVMNNFPVTLDKEALSSKEQKAEDIEDMAIEQVLHSFETKIKRELSTISKIQELMPEAAPQAPAAAILNEIVRSILIRNIDKYWQEHLLNIDHLRAEVHLRVVGQKDPLLEFKHEAFALFDQFSLKIKVEIAHAMFKFEMMPPPQPVEEAPKPTPQARLFNTAFSLDNLVLEEEEEVATLEKD